METSLTPEMNQTRIFERERVDIANSLPEELPLTTEETRELLIASLEGKGFGKTVRISIKDDAPGGTAYLRTNKKYANPQVKIVFRPNQPPFIGTTSRSEIVGVYDTRTRKLLGFGKSYDVLQDY